MRIEIYDEKYEDGKLLKERLDALSVATAIGAIYDYSTAEIVIKSMRDKKNKLFPDIVIMEAEMNGGPPAALIRMMRGILRLEKIPILIYTNTKNQAQREACLLAGGNELFIKDDGPNGTTALIDRVKTLSFESSSQ